MSKAVQDAIKAREDARTKPAKKAKAAKPAAPPEAPKDAEGGA
jgi:hypothetical protein